MRRSVFIIIIQSFSFYDLNVLRKTRRHQLFRYIERNDLFDKLPSPSKQLIIESFIEK